MKILVLSNYYPPHELGGQGRSCLQVVEGLKDRGHEVLVLTSMHGTNNVPIVEDGVWRSLYLEMDLVPWKHGLIFFTQRDAREQHNLAAFNQTLQELDPDVIYVWGMWNLPRSLPALVEASRPGKVIYRFADYWPTLPSQHEAYWKTPGRKWYSQGLKYVVSRVALWQLSREKKKYPLRFEHSICVSAATRDILVEAGIPVSGAKIIHTGLDLKTFTPVPAIKPADEPGALNLLYAGRLSSTKGIDTAIKAMAVLVFERGFTKTTLSLAGGGSQAYEAYLRRLVSEKGLNEHIQFLGLIPPEEMPEVMKKYDALVVPSVWEEPFARVVLEGMISGLVVLATPTGGTKEILLDGENGLLFSPGNAIELAEKTTTLLSDPALRMRLAAAGQETVLQNYTQRRMMDEMEGFLKEVAFSVNGGERE